MSDKLYIRYVSSLIHNKNSILSYFTMTINITFYISVIHTKF